jgi:hypothetical protein
VGKIVPLPGNAIALPKKWICCDFARTVAAFIKRCTEAISDVSAQLSGERRLSFDEDLFSPE